MKLLGILLLALFAVSIFAEETQDSNNGQMSKKDSVAIIDFSPQKLELFGHEGQFFDTMIVVHNYGNIPLKLKKVQASCSCSSGTLQQGTVMPDKTGKIYISINKHGLHGDARRVEFDVYSNAEDPISSFEIIFYDKKSGE